MRAYSASDEEALLARDLVKDWTGEGFLTAEQRQQMEIETVCNLRRTNIFLRIVLFLFTLLIVVATIGFFFVTLFLRPDTQATGIFLLIFAALSYGATEFAISQYRLYRYGIEEALAACSVGLLCAGLAVSFSIGSVGSSGTTAYPAASIAARMTRVANSALSRSSGSSQLAAARPTRFTSSRQNARAIGSTNSSERA